MNELVTVLEIKTIKTVRKKMVTKMLENVLPRACVHAASWSDEGK